MGGGVVYDGGYDDGGCNAELRYVRLCYKRLRAVEATREGVGSSEGSAVCWYPGIIKMRVYLLNCT